MKKRSRENIDPSPGTSGFLKKTGIEGHVVSSRFLGDNNLVSIAFVDREIPVTVKIPATLPINLGDMLNFKTLDEHVLIFPS